MEACHYVVEAGGELAHFDRRLPEPCPAAVEQLAGAVRERLAILLGAGSVRVPTQPEITMRMAHIRTRRRPPVV